MFKKNLLRASVVGVVAAALVAVTAGTAQAAVDPTVGSKGPIYMASALDGSLIAPGTILPFDESVIARASDTDLEALFIGSDDSTEVRTFISPRGSEATPSAWVAYAYNGFVNGTKNVSYPNLALDGQTIGSLSAVRAGGNWSVGFAFMNNNGLNVSTDGVYFKYITVTPGVGNALPTWEFAPDDTVVPPVDPPVGSADVNLQAITMAAEDGTLNLVAPSLGTAQIKDPTLVNGLSTSKGKLGVFEVQDTRVVTHKGWTVTTKVDNFVNALDATKIISSSQLGLKPLAAEGTTLSPIVTLANEQIAGSANHVATTTPATVQGNLFAQAGDSAAVPSSKFDADLTFVAPADMPAGTYNSKLTLTLTSK
ncbi:hypothetical protein ACEXQD_17030 [Herbiconiux sp. P15]|uniref:hypothetical protein n=1 Tax=Herbiconiux liukaitaii TaxID=3342799 RepID=UPI0035B75F71